MSVTSLAPWFGGNRMLAPHVGEALKGCSWVGVPFAGGMSELPHIGARTILVNDLHRLVINLARVVADDRRRPQLIERVSTKAFHPDELKKSQHVCKMLEDDLADDETSLVMAEHYFVCCWMARTGKAGVKNEFSGRTATRWNANGGDSVVRYHSAVAMLETFSATLKRCTFETMDGIDFIARCEDNPVNGIYADPPFPGAGLAYKYHPPKDDEIGWHTRLRDALLRFERTRVVCRFYDVPLVRDLYSQSDWRWLALKGRKQTNEESPEVLLTRNGPSLRGGLFA